MKKSKKIQISFGTVGCTHLLMFFFLVERNFMKTRNETKAQKKSKEMAKTTTTAMTQQTLYLHPKHKFSLQIMSRHIKIPKNMRKKLRTHKT